MNESYVVLGLATLNVVQFIFWSFQVHRLVNKLMSRNFAEYSAIINPVTTKRAELEDENLGAADPLDELNAMIQL